MFWVVSRDVVSCVEYSDVVCCVGSSDVGGCVEYSDVVLDAVMLCVVSSDVV